VVVQLGWQWGRGPQLIQAQPLGVSGELVTVQIAEGLDANGHLSYFAPFEHAVVSLLLVSEYSLTSEFIAALSHPRGR
jgi:hypothetical protein